jgi:predicted dinucleotide-binding enzyme
MNYYPQRDGRIAELDTGELTSSALVQRHLADSRVVKAFNNSTSAGCAPSPCHTAHPTAVPCPSQATTPPPSWR